MTSFNCEKCNLIFEFKSKYDKHLTSKKHTGIPRKERTDKTYNPKCYKCNFESSNHTNMKVHLLTKHGTPEKRREEFTYYCDKCDFGTFTEILFMRHTDTLKHQLDT